MPFTVKNAVGRVCRFSRELRQYCRSSDVCIVLNGNARWETAFLTSEFLCWRRSTVSIRISTTFTRIRYRLFYTVENISRLVNNIPDFVARLYDGKIRVPVTTLKGILFHEYNHAENERLPAGEYRHRGRLQRCIPIHYILFPRNSCRFPFRALTREK
jgi:hypothetical protein